MQQLEFFEVIDKPTLVCPVCKKNFEKTTYNRRYCSEDCRLKSHIKIEYKDSFKEIKKTCDFCGKLFMISNKFALNKKYCSEDCRSKKYPKKEITEIKKTCDFCGNFFTTSNQYAGNQNKKFCSLECGQNSIKNSRKEKRKTPFEFYMIKDEKINGRKGNIHPNFCVYCGDFNQCRDHVIPVSYNSVYRNYSLEDTVDCCNMCNQLALDYPAQSIEEKSLYLINQYHKKYSKVLNNPKWEDDEIDELSGNLKYKVKASENLKRLIENKLENLHLSSMGTLPKRLKSNIGFYF
jgi:hypothetical protein